MKIKKSQRNSRFFFHRMGLIFFFLPLLILVLGIVLPDRGFSEKENRVLASAPGLKLNQLTSGGFEKQFETYENDQFPLRDLWITLKASADRLMGKSRRKRCSSWKKRLSDGRIQISCSDTV